MKKKLLTLVLLLAVLVCAVAASGVFAAPKELYEYEVRTDGTVGITGADNSIRDAVIPAELDGRRVTAIASHAFLSCGDLVTVTIPEGVESIGDWAFANARGLISINIPDSLVSIGGALFNSGASPEIKISPDHPVFAVENSALVNKRDMTLIFYLDRGNTGAYEIPRGIRRIEAEAFETCRLSSLVIPDSVTVIGQSAMSYCPNLTEIVVPDSVKRIEQYAFSGCHKLESVSIPSGVAAIGTGAFSRCDRLAVGISPDNPAFEVIDGLLVHKSNREITGVIGDIKGEYMIPEGIRAVGDGVFSGYDGITAITVPDSVTGIGENAFDRNTVIRARAGSAAQKYCGEYGNRFEETAPASGQAPEEKEQPLFRYRVRMEGTAEITGVNDKDIVTAEIPAEMDGYPVTVIGYDAFSDCDKLETLVIPEGVESIQPSAFRSCASLRSVNIPDSVTELAGQPFPWNGSLGTIDVSPDHPVFAVENDALVNKQTMTLIRYLDSGYTGEYIVPQGIRAIGTEAFEHCSLSAVVLPDSLTGIGALAFNSCRYLAEAVIPEGVVCLEHQVFCHCSRLASVTIPDSAVFVGKGVFAYCGSLESIRISPDHPFYEVNDRILVDRRNQAVVSASCAISGRYEIPAGIREIGSHGFQGCDRITELVIPEGVTAIRDYAFSNCDSLVEMTVPASVKEIEYNAIRRIIFSDSASDCVVKVPAGSYALRYCEEKGIRFEVLE